MNLQAAAARTGLDRARERGYEIPEFAVTNAAMVAECERIATLPAPTLDALPDTPDKLLPVLRKHAIATATHAAVLEANAVALDWYERNVSMAYRRALPEWVDAVVSDFDRWVKELRAAFAHAPSALTGYEDAEVVAAAQTVKRTSHELESLLWVRRSFGETIGEQGLHQSVIWQFVAPPAADGDAARVLAELARDYRNADWQQLTPPQRWTSLAALPIELSLAPLGQITTREEAWRRLDIQPETLPQLTPLGEAQRSATRSLILT